MPEVHFVGELRSCRGFLPPRLSLSIGDPYSSLSAHWQVETGDERHWRHLEGETNGKTWLAQREGPTPVAAWNSPIDFTYAFTSIDGWPMILITVMETDRHNRQDLGGYGVFRLPTSPGKHIRQIPIARPRGTWGDAVTAFFVGGRPRYDHPSVLLSGASRYGHETVSMGMIEVEMNVILQGFDEPQFSHVTFDTDQSQAAIEAASVCQHCPITSTANGGTRQDDEGDEDEDGANQPLLARKQQ